MNMIGVVNITADGKPHSIWERDFNKEYKLINNISTAKDFAETVFFMAATITKIAVVMDDPAIAAMSIALLTAPIKLDDSFMWRLCDHLPHTITVFNQLLVNSGGQPHLIKD